MRRRRINEALLLVFTLAFWPATGSALDVVIGQRVELEATNPQGVPLHRNPRPSMFGRAPDGTIATVIGLEHDRHWLNLSLPDGRTGWIVERYVARVLPATTGPEPVDQENDEWEVWSSADRCEAVVRAGRRMRGEIDGAVRIATWNIRWFPDGEMNPPPDRPRQTDLRWLACAIAWMNVDLLALQEIRATQEATDAWESVRDGITGLVGGDWRLGLQDCGANRAQHVGFLWNADRLTLPTPEEVWQLNGAADGPDAPCAGNLRPGLQAYVEPADGAGFDFHVVVVHSDSGRSARDFENRGTAIGRIDTVATGLLATDADIVILGDFNTMGMSGGPTAPEELDQLAAAASTEAPGFGRLAVEPACTEYFNREPGWLDHVLVTSATQEAATGPAVVTGYCALAACDRIDGNMPAAYQVLSDHCPVIAEFRNQDLD